MSKRVLVEADRYIGGIGVLHEVSMLSTEPHEDEQELESKERNAVHGDDERLVGTLEYLSEVIEYRLLRHSRTAVLVEGERESVFSFDG